MTTISLRPAMDDRIVDVVRRAAQTKACHAVFVSRGALEGDDRARLLSLLPEPFGRRLGMAPDSLELLDDLESAEDVFAAVRAALDEARLGFAAHALLARRDGIVLLAQKGSTSTIRSLRFPGFDDAD